MLRWCCDISDAPDRMVHLGNHAEVNLCLRCAHFVHQQAWEIEDEGKGGPAAFARDRFRNLRAEVIRRAGGTRTGSSAAGFAGSASTSHSHADRVAVSPGLPA